MMKRRPCSASLLCLALLAPSLLLAGACNPLGGVGEPERGCTLIGCDDQVSVLLRGLVADQRYDVRIQTQDQSTHCDIDTSDGLRMSCNGALFVSDRLDEASIVILGVPERVAITVRQSGGVVADELLTPSYEEVMPNGPRCEPTCLQAQIVVTL